MRSSQQLLALFAAGAFAIPTEEKRDLAECTSVAFDLMPALMDVPTPSDSKLLDFIASQTQFTTATDACVVPYVTGSYSSEFTSYMSELSSWQMKHTDDMNSLISACSDVPEVSSEIAALPATTVCSEITWETAAASSDNSKSDSKDKSDSDSDASSDSSSDDDEDAAPRVAGALYAAVAAAAVAVMAL